MRSAVLLLAFNRPEPTHQVLQALQKARPPRLYVAIDGPRASRPQDAVKCAEVRDLVSREVDWPCQVNTLYREENLGCRRAVSGAITWFFEHETEGIILEDDCVPVPDFFRFCDLALATWRDDARVMHVGGHVLVEGSGPADVHASHLVPIWGWATWRRAWTLYDSEMELLPKLRKLPLRSWFGWQTGNVIRTITKVHTKKMNVWGARWVLTVLANSGMSILPRVNLISNVGFGAEATNTDVESDVAHIPTGRLPEVIKLPEKLTPDRRYDESYLSVIYKLGPRLRRLMIRISRRVGIVGA